MFEEIYQMGLYFILAWLHVAVLVFNIIFSSDMTYQSVGLLSALSFPFPSLFIRCRVQQMRMIMNLFVSYEAYKLLDMDMSHG
jgi:hypothetical protein